MDHLAGDAEADFPIEQKLAAYRGEVSRLQLMLASTPKPAPPIDVERLVRQLTDQLLQFGENLDAKDHEIIRQMVNLLVGRMEVDLMTRDTEIDLRLPDWIGPAVMSLPTMSLDQVIPWNTPNEAHHADAALLARFRCEQTHARPVCFECHRVRRAA